MNIAYFTNKEYYEDAVFHDKKFASPEYFEIGTFHYHDYFQIHEGMTGEKLELKDIYTNFW